MHVAGHGRIDDARRLAAAARGELDTFGERWNEPMVLMGEAAVALAAGDAPGAAAALARAAEVATFQGAHGIANRARRSPGATAEATSPGPT